MPPASSPARSALDTRPPAGPKTSPPAIKPARPGIWILLGGVILPLAALAMELATHQCAEAFFDPIPTWWHVALIACVPLFNIVFRLWPAEKPLPWWFADANGFVGGISFAYAVVFAPLLPLAVTGLMIMGWGLLPMAPLIAFGISFGNRVLLQRAGAGRRVGGWLAFAAAVVMLAFFPARDHLTQWAARLAVDPDAATQQRGFTLLRAFGSRASLLAMCYPGTREWPGQMFGNSSGTPIEAEQAQKLHYRLTGVSYNTLPVPAASGNVWRGGRRETFDSALGGTLVAGRVPDLSLASSRLDAKVDTAALTSYTEWTLVFKNSAADPSEARAQIELPAGGVVSRLTLWINGEPQEAAFGGRAQVRAAYQEVAVVQRRDPVLVTTCGPDRVLMQCFPVPAHGEMKVRLGITAPLIVADERTRSFHLPRVLEVNYVEPSTLRHEAWVESDAPISPPDFKTTAQRTVRLPLTTERLAAGGAWTAAIEPSDVENWTDDPHDPLFVIRQRLSRETAAPPKRVAIVVDGSQGMERRAREIGPEIEKIPNSMELQVMFAGDTVDQPWTGWQPATPERKAEAARWIQARPFRGGTDNLPALLAAWDAAASEPGTALVWVHGSQPILLSSAESLLQRLERDHTPPALHDIPIGTGPNRVAEQFNGFTRFHTERSADALKTLFARWQGSSPQWVSHRERIPRMELLAGAIQTDRHLARLWGAEEVERLRISRTPGSLDQAVKLAIGLQLVTPVSGAVVLETKEQFARHDLKQADSDSAPNIPEPTAAVLAGFGVAALASRRWRRRVAS